MNAQAVAPKKSNFEVELENYESQIAAALPSHISVDKFKRVLMTAIARDPALYTEADRRSLFNAAIQCATDGLVPDGREAALVIFNTKDRKTNQWVKAVAYIPMVHGIRKKMRNTGEVSSAEAHCIFQKDHFDYALGDEAYITHKPVIGDRGAMIGAYAIIKLTNGEVLREVMSRAEIEKVRAVSKSKDSGPWVSWFEEQARKTVLKRCSKAAPMSADLERLMSRGDEPEPVAAIAPPRPTRQDTSSWIEPPSPRVTQAELDEAAKIGDAAAGHEDLDAKFRATVPHDDDGVISDDSGAHPAETATSGGIATPEPASGKAGGQPDAADEYDPDDEYKKLWAGALDETTALGVKAYWDMQREEGAAGWKLWKKAPDLFDELGGKILTRQRVLKNGEGAPA